MQFLDAKKYKKEVKKLYRCAFPADERAPLFMLFNKTKYDRYNFYAIVEDGEFVGLIYTIETEKMVYVFFFAITEQNRGKGYGTKALECIKNMHPDKVIALMIEDTTIASVPNLEERINRLGFYERNGFERLGIHINEAGVDYELLGTDKTITCQDFLNMMKDYVGSLLFKILYRKMNLD